MFNPLALTQLQEQCDKVAASDALLNYVLALVHDSRNQTDAVGLSPRATKALLQAAKAWHFRGQTLFSPRRCASGVLQRGRTSTAH